MSRRTSISISILGLLLLACGDRKPAQNVIQVDVDAGPSTPIVAVPLGSSVVEPPRVKHDGPAAPQFSLKSYTGGHCELAQNKVTVVHFFATWCAPCQRSFPELQSLQHK